MSSTGGWRPTTVKLPTGPAAREPVTGEVNGGDVVGVPADPANARVVTVLFPVASARAWLGAAIASSDPKHWYRQTISQWTLSAFSSW